MSIDMSQFYQVFFEETAEHLASMETLLLELDIQAPDAEQLNAVFRAAHSIKGSSGTFGFTDLQDVTHILENLLDKIRKHEIELRDEMIDAFLDAGDVLKNLLAAHQGDGEADRAAAEAICVRLRGLTDNPGVASVPASQPSAAPVAVAPVAEGNPDGTPSSVAVAEPALTAEAGLDILFQFDGASCAEAAEQLLDSLVAELATQGEVRILGRAAGDQAWHLQMVGSPDAQAVRGILEFVARNDSIRIAALGQSGAATQGDAPDGVYGFFGEESPAAPVEEAYGFFVDLPAAPAPEPPPPAQAYGFFDASPGVPTVAEPVPAPAKEEAYGFFEPLPSSVETAPAPVSEPGGAKLADAADGAYGFFVETVPAAPAPAAPDSSVAAVAAVAAAPAVATPAAPPKPASTESKRPAPVAAKPAAGGDTTIRVGVDKVDQLINLVGELVITQAMLAQSAAQIDPVEFERLHSGLIQLERNTRDLQESVMSIRMMPMSVVFSRFPRVVRDLSQKLGKQVELKTSGESTELDKSLIERITDPLTHLIRNSLDHGIEMPEERAAKGKQPVGTITLSAYHQSGNIVIEVGDDGAGLPRNKILAKAKERGLNVHEQMTDQEVFGLIFEAGFSTADQITEVSGRGVGMDVVKKNIAAMGGRVEINSMMGVGTRMTVRLPLTLAILDGMSVAVGNETYIIPLGYVIESLQAEHGMIKSVSGVERLLQVRGEYLPIVVLHEIFKVPDALSPLEEGIMIILETDGAKAALFVDAMVGQHQVVIKSLESNYRKVSGVSGATIMGDGRVAMILDVSMLVSMARSS
jgi:two-component system chemotaxis sensor kinase CheA